MEVVTLLDASDTGRRVLQQGLALVEVIRPLLNEAVDDAAQAIGATQVGVHAQSYLGVPKYRPTMAEAKNEIGLATGLAWTEVGGELLTIESVTVPGKGGIKSTGKLGDVMQESGHAAVDLQHGAHRQGRHLRLFIQVRRDGIRGAAATVGAAARLLAGVGAFRGGGILGTHNGIELGCSGHGTVSQIKKG